MTIKNILSWLVVMAIIGTGAYFTRDKWWHYLDQSAHNQPSVPTPKAESAHSDEDEHASSNKLLLSDNAIENLRLKAKASLPGTYWKTLELSGLVVDRIGQSELNIPAPADAVVTSINHQSGNRVQVGEALFELRLRSERLHTAQVELFKTAKDIEFAKAQKARLQSSGGAVPESRITEVEQQITRFELTLTAHRRELLSNGLTEEQIASAMNGNFVQTSVVKVPAPKTTQINPDQLMLEVKEIRVQLGQQVEAGQSLCILSNHAQLAIEGYAFADETPLLQKSYRERWPVQVDFQEQTSDWPKDNQVFQIEHIANTIDPQSRTFAFRMPLINVKSEAHANNNTPAVWRYRPGQRVRLAIRTEQIDNVFVFPADAVASDGGESVVFLQNVNTFERKQVRLLMKDRANAIVANDGSLVPGSFIVQQSASQLNRMLKSKGSGAPAGYHIHADGSLHKNDANESH